MIEAKNISKSYGKNTIIRNSSFNLKSNEISFLMGPNGHGKTTLIKCMMGMESFEGEFFFNRKSIDKVRRETLVIWDDCPFYTNLSGFKNLHLFSEGKKNKKEIREIALSFLREDLLNQRVKKYSYGQKKILSLALVEILEPDYLIMDEISNGLDFNMMRYAQKLIQKWKTHATVLLTGHQFAFYNEIIDDVFIIKNQNVELLVKDFQNSDLKLEDLYDEAII